MTSFATLRRGRRAHGLIFTAVLAVLGGTMSMPPQGELSRTVSTLVPTLSVNPTSGQVGATVTLSGGGFTLAGANVLWDGSIRDSFIISGGSFTRSFIIPASPTGNHTISVCGSVLPLGSPCNSGEFEEKANATFRVDPTPPDTTPTTGRVDYQVIALEVTQAVRGDIPTRSAPDGSSTLPLDDAVHVANRHTVVRAYPWVRAYSGGVIRPVTAVLQVHQGGGVWSAGISPTTSLLVPAAGRSLADMRANAALSFNFVLPRRYLAEGTRSIRVLINPAGAGHAAETTADAANNTVALPNVRFRTVQTRPIDFRVYLADVAWRDSAGEVVHYMPSHPEISAALGYLVRTWPIDPSQLRVSYHYSRISQNPPPYDDTHPFLVDPPIPGYPQWDNQVYLDENPDLLEPRVFRRPPYSFIWLAFDTGSWMGCAGHAGIGYTPLFHAGACGPTVAQEATHSLSLNHAANAHGEEFGGGFNPDYPGSHGQVEAHAYGFDIFELRAIPPDLGGHTHDFMSYGGDPQWVSIYTWETMAGFFDASDINVGRYSPRSAGLLDGRPMTTSAAADTEYLSIGGTIHQDTVYLSPVFTVVAPAGAGEGATGAAYTLTVRDSSGGALVERAFTPYASSEPGTSQFYELVPAVSGAAKIEIRRGGQLIGTRSAGSRAPQVRLVSPVAGDQWAAQGETVVRWEGSDPDGDPLTYRVQMSTDGQTWRTISGAASQTQAPVNLAYLPGSGKARIRVQATDGLNVTSAEVGNVPVAPKPPIPTILRPTGRTFVATGDSLDVLGQGYDVQDGHLPATGLRWLVDNKPIGTGGSANTGALSAGEHKLTLRATNKAGLNGVAELTIVAGPDKDRDRLPDSWEAQVGLSAADPADAAGDLDGDGVLNWQEYDLDSDPRDPKDPARHSSHEFEAAPIGTRLDSSPDSQLTNLIVMGAALAVLLLAGSAVLWYRARRRKA